MQEPRYEILKFRHLFKTRLELIRNMLIFAKDHRLWWRSCSQNYSHFLFFFVYTKMPNETPVVAESYRANQHQHQLNDLGDYK